MHDDLELTVEYMASTDWGYDKSILQSTYISRGRSTVVCSSGMMESCGAWRQQTGAMINLSYSPPTYLEVGRLSSM